jgi:hypothetical protein
LFILALLSIISMAVFILLRYYNDEVVQYVVGQVNQRLKTRASVESVDLTFWETFPNTSIHFHKLMVEDAMMKGDTLLYAGDLYLAFNLSDIISGNYKISKAKAEETAVHLRRSADGEANWHIWKEGNDSTRFEIDLRKIQLQNCAFDFEDDQQHFWIDLYTRESSAKGNFAGQDYTFEANSKLWVQDLYKESVHYAVEKSIDFKGKINKNGNVFAFATDKLSLDEIPFAVTGSISTGDDGQVQMEIKSKDTNLSKLIAVVPEIWKKKLDRYQSKGIVDIEATISGPLRGAGPDVRANMALSKGQLKENNTGGIVKNIDLQLSYTKVSGKDLIQIRQCSGELESGKFLVSGSIANLQQPLIDLDLETATQLQHVKKFLALDTLQQCAGSLEIKAQLKGPLKRFENVSGMSWEQVNITGSALLHDGILQLKESSRIIHNLQASIQLDNKDAQIRELKGNLGNSDFSIEGNVKNLLPFLFDPEERLEVNASLNCNQLDFGSFVEKQENSSQKSKEYRFTLPKRIHYKLQSSIQHFTFNRMQADRIVCTLDGAEETLNIQSLHFESAGGSANAQLQISRTASNQYAVICQAQLQNIDIQKLFYQFDNFGQNYITDQQIRGKTSVQLNLSVPFTESLKIVENDLISQVSVSIDQGQIIELEVLQQIAEYIRKNKFLAPFVDEDKLAEKLKNISFSKMENTIDIRDRMIRIPQMDIKSSVMDISAQGTHSFDNVVDYTIGFNLRDILIKKNNADEQDDRLGRQIFVYMKGTTSNPQFGMDKDASKQNRKLALDQEKQNIKALLKEEFGLFKKDVKVGEYKEKKDQKTATTTIEWEGYNDNQPVQSTETKESLRDNKPQTQESPKRENDKGKKLPRWLQEKPDETKKTP